MDYNESVNAMLDKLDRFFKTETVVGQPIVVENVTLVPITSVSFGFGGGSGSGKDRGGADNSGGGAGAGGKITPVAILVIKKDGEVRIVALSERDSLDKIIGMVPEIISKIKPEGLGAKTEAAAATEE
jgi:uncharacterized spore protein YtfJ